jgi:NAD(P)-dependent dehydrogenase (short-subunit alcohol dehydrogenase family)
MAIALFFVAVMLTMANPFTELEVAPLDGRGINPLLSHPGMFIHPPMLMTGLSQEVYDEMTKQTPLGYVAEPEEIAGPVVFLASDHAKYITGATINVSGGFLMY